MRLAMKPARSAGPALRIRTAGHALLVHPKGPPEPSALAFAGALTPDPEHTLVVVDLLPADLDTAWPALADLLARRPGSLRLVFHPSVEGPPVGQRIADQLNRTVLTPDGEALPTAGGGLFVPADSGTGWLRLRPGRAAERDSHRYPKPLWEFATYDRIWQTSPLGVVEPVPGGVWVRSARPAELAAGRRRLIAALPGHPNALTVVLGSPGGPAVPLADVTRFWGTVLPSARTGVRFVHFGPVALPEGSGALGQVLADALRQRVVLSPGPAASDAAEAAGAAGSAGSGPALQGEVIYSPAPGYLAEPPAWNADADAPAVRVVEPPVASVEAPAPVVAPVPVSTGAAEGVVELGPVPGSSPTPAAGTVVELDPVPVSAPEPVAESASAPLPLPTSLATSSPGPVADWPAPAFEPKVPVLETESEAAPEHAPAPTTPPVLTSLLESAPPVPVAPPEPVAPVPPVAPGAPVPPVAAVPPALPKLPSIEPSNAPAPAPEATPPAEPPTAPDTDDIQPPTPAPTQGPEAVPPALPKLPSIEPSNAPAPALEATPPAEPLTAPDTDTDIDTDTDTDTDDIQPPTPAPAMPRMIRLESGAPATPPPVEPAPSVDAPTPPPAAPTTPAVPPVAALATGVRVQPVPSAAALALPPERGLERERDWVRRKFSAQYHAVAGTVARVMSESPGLRSASRALDGDALTDLVAVRLYLYGDSAAVDAAVRSGSAGPHVPLARCVASGLFRLPSYRGVALLRASVTRSELDWYEEGRAATEWAFCTARITVPETPGDGTTDFLIWSMTARRTSLLDPSDPDRVLFPPGTTFKVLRAGSATEPVLLRELLPSEGDEDADPDAPRLPLDEIALEGLTQAAEQLPTGSPTRGGPPLAAPPGLITTTPVPPARAAQGTRAPIEGAEK
ncbi:hypothetical protein PUR71_06760 [Streptomyces sp. SP17BM10]|uniref:hypothetical protein n=1 Tax=Streptomyces sp. SP17BM10 TaxID=3002530 RepID=UPI002E769EA7|nr:hypothetical protein [Streptomyces sp. SP17BM10]MEE1782623.1 hypothetical protein [Streptomyces sp. SP17BM10]